MDTELSIDTVTGIDTTGTSACTEAECLGIGGHCWVEAPHVLTSNPAQFDRSCKHCGKRQRGVAQPGISWGDM